MTARNKDGRMKFLTAYQFAKSKARTDTELDIIYRAIGPKPVTLKDISQANRVPGHSVPYLGDWQQLRAAAYFYDTESLNKMKETITQQLDGLEAGRGAATLVLDLLAKAIKSDNMIDEVFGGTPVLDGLSLSKQEKRAGLFFKLKRQSTGITLDLLDKYLACHGISPNGLNSLGNLVTAVGSAAARGALQGAAAGGALSQPDSPALAILTKALYERSKTFNMQLPVALLDEGESDEGERK